MKKHTTFILLTTILMFITTQVSAGAGTGRRCPPVVQEQADETPNTSHYSEVNI